MFTNPVAKLIKDIVIAVLAIIIVTWISFSLGTSFFPSVGLGFVLAGVPFGWTWLSKIFSAFSLPTLFIKFFLSIFLGWIAIFIVIGKDIFDLVTIRKC